MEILNNFGFNPLLLAAQIVNFLIIFYLLKRFMFKPVLSLLQKRQEMAKKTLADAQSAAALLEKTQSEEKKVLHKAKEEAEKLLIEVKNQNTQLRKEAEESTKKKIDTMITDAREQISRESKEAEKRIAVHVSKIAADMLKVSLKELLGEKEQQEVIKKAAKTLKN